MRHYTGNGARLIYDVVRERGTDDPGPMIAGPIRSADNVAALVRKLQACGYWPLEREAFGVILLDTRHRFMGLHIVSVGTLNSSLVHPRETFRVAIVAGAAALLLIHNHPSGSTNPSIEDRTLTTRLQSAGTLLGIECLDHVIVARHGHYSFAQE